MSRFAVLVAAVLMTGCVRDDLVDCGNGLACASGTECAKVTIAAEERVICVAPDAFDRCDDLDEGAPCMLDEGVPGTCHGSACLPSVCGNSLLDVDEVCDDGNGISGDGCSFGCMSNETCSNGVIDPLRITADTTVASEQCDEGDLLGHDGCSSTCQNEALRWEPLEIGLPPGRYAPTLAYDSARDRVVMFGGATIGPFGLPIPRDDTWEWDGVAWIRIPTSITPSARYGHVMSYDPVRRRTVMFGGGTNANVFADTWEWDGTTWELRSPPLSPSGRRYAAGSYDSIRKRFVVFGGIEQPAPARGDTWEWDGTTWTERILSPSPPARASAAMAFDPVRGATVLAGGISSTVITDTWEYDGARWAMSPATYAGGVPNGMAFDGVGLVAFGSEADTTRRPNTARYDGQTWTRPLPVGSFEPSTRIFAAMVADPRRGRVLLVQGLFLPADCPIPNCERPVGDVLAWDKTRWTPVTVSSPSARAFQATAYDSHRGCTVVFSGGDSYGTPTASGTWELCGDHWISRPGPQPPARTEAAMTYDPERKQTILYGGYSENFELLGDTWIWNGTTWTEGPTGPSPRLSAVMTFDPVNRTVLLFGGYVSGEMLGETWEWNGSAWTLRTPVHAPPARARHAMVVDPIRERALLVGGDNFVQTLADLWEWDGADWIERTQTAIPPARSGHAIAWNPARQRAVMFGGSVQRSSLYSDVWELNDAQWLQQFASGGPTGRYGHSLSSRHDGVIAFGGASVTIELSELWRLRWDDNRANELCTLAADTDGDGLAGCSDPDCWFVCAPQCPPGAPCPATAPRCGDGACNGAIETCRMCPGDCGPCMAACGDNVCDSPENAASCPGDCP